MSNPIPAEIRKVLYLIGAVASAISVAGTAILPPVVLSSVLLAAVALNVLAAANVPNPGDSER